MYLLYSVVGVGIGTDSWSPSFLVDTENRLSVIGIARRTSDMLETDRAEWYMMKNGESRGNCLNGQEDRTGKG